MPERRRLLDQALGAAERFGHGQRQPATQRDRTKIVVEPQFNIRPVALVGLVADGEVKAMEAAVDGAPQQLVQMSASGAELGDIAIDNTR